MSDPARHRPEPGRSCDIIGALAARGFTTYLQDGMVIFGTGIAIPLEDLERDFEEALNVVEAMLRSLRGETGVPIEREWRAWLYVPPFREERSRYAYSLHITEKSG